MAWLLKGLKSGLRKGNELDTEKVHLVSVLSHFSIESRLKATRPKTVLSNMWLAGKVSTNLHQKFIKKLDHMEWCKEI